VYGSWHWGENAWGIDERWHQRTWRLLRMRNPWLGGQWGLQIVELQVVDNVSG
jgi:hypothetical protein